MEAPKQPPRPSSSSGGSPGKPLPPKRGRFSFNNGGFSLNNSGSPPKPRRFSFGNASLFSLNNSGRSPPKPGRFSLNNGGFSLNNSGSPPKPWRSSFSGGSPQKPPPPSSGSSKPPSSIGSSDCFLPEEDDSSPPMQYNLPLPEPFRINTAVQETQPAPMETQAAAPAPIPPPAALAPIQHQPRQHGRFHRVVDIPPGELPEEEEYGHALQGLIDLGYRRQRVAFIKCVAAIFAVVMVVGITAFVLVLVLK